MSHPPQNICLTKKLVNVHRHGRLVEISGFLTHLVTVTSLLDMINGAPVARRTVVAAEAHTERSLI